MYKIALINKFLHAVSVLVLGVAISATATAGDLSYKDAWEKFSNGNFVEAEAIVDAKLSTDIESMLLKANYLYLKANIQSKRAERYQEALYSYETALQLYTISDNDYGIYVSNLGMARIFIREGRTGEAEAALNVNIQTGEANNYPLTYPYYLLARLAFARGEYEQAMNLSYLSLKHLKTENPRDKADALLTYGFYQMLNGYLESGYELTLKGQVALVESGDHNKHYYSLINMALYRRSQGLEADGLLQMIDRRAVKDGDDDLLELVRFVQGFDCAQLSLMESEPPPAPPPT